MAPLVKRLRKKQRPSESGCYATVPTQWRESRDLAVTLLGKQVGQESKEQSKKSSHAIHHSELGFEFGKNNAKEVPGSIS